MAISSSLYSSISGLSTMGEAMSVLGDNVANVNTAAFKSSRSTFQDVLSQSVSTAAGGAQVGRGVTLSTINSLFAQGSFESSSSPTDMAIGGQGFFMLRASSSAEADMYSRAGEFGFDQYGNLVNPMGYFAQGWTIDSSTGQRQGTIGDINIGKNTPPVATTSVDVIVNVDSRKINETTEDRLFANWNGTNAAATNPSAPIDPSKYEYTTSVKVYDSKGASHDLTIYYDRTTKDNQWEYLVTCDPADDLRALTTSEQQIYNPDTRYNFENHKGAGALMYGILQFDTSGNIAQIDAFNVPPDGQVDPSKSTNRFLLEAGTSYFSFPANFNGADTNQQVQINFGAIYEGKSSTQNQVLVSDLGARALGTGGDVSTYITSATTWSRVADSNGNTITQGDMFIFEGYDNGSDPVNRLVYTVHPGNDIQDLLTQLEETFHCSAAIDSQGRLTLTDDISGESSMYVTRFETVSANSSIPFGGTHSTVDKAYSITASGITSDGSTKITNEATSLIALQGTSLPKIAANDTFTFSGTDVDGNAVTDTTFTVGVTGTTITQLLAFIDATFGGVDSGVQSVLDQDGRIRVVDTTQSGSLLVNATFRNSSDAPIALVATSSAAATTALASATAAAAAPADPALAATALADALTASDAAADTATAAGVALATATAADNAAGVALAADPANPALIAAKAATAARLVSVTAFNTACVTAAASAAAAAAANPADVALATTANTDGLAALAAVPAAVSTTANPFGLVDGTTTPLTQKQSVTGQINFSSSKKMLISNGRAFSTNSGDTTTILPTTLLSSVYDDNSDPTINGGLPRGLKNGDKITLDGTKRDGTNVTSILTVVFTKPDGNPGTIQDLLDQLESDFDCKATIDKAGRLVLTDNVADTVASPSSLAITSIAYEYATNPDPDGAGPLLPDPDSAPDIFGITAFDWVPSDITSEDGSTEGAVVTTGFSPEALSTTQYANSSTTIFQDQDGFASGFLQSVSTDVDGIITGHYSNGQVLKKAQVALANFSNLAGLSKKGGNIFSETTESGAPVTGAPGTNGLGSIAPNALEQSNVDLGVEFVKLITVQRGFQANSKIITTTDEMLNELINIKR